MKLLLNEEFIKYWRKYPDKFVDEFFGVKLFTYQKLLLKILNKKLLKILNKKWRWNEGNIFRY